MQRRNGYRNMQFVTSKIFNPNGIYLVFDHKKKRTVFSISASLTR